MRASPSLTMALVAGLLAACASSNAGSYIDGGDSDAQVCSRDEDCIDDGLYCNGGTVCRDLRCVASSAPNCSDGVMCTVDSCDEDRAGCLNIPDDELCDEGLVCNESEGCSTPPTCEFDNDCDDDDYICNGSPICEVGECVNQPLDCDDLDDCTEDSCDEDVTDGCVNTAYDTQNDADHCGAACTPCPAPGPLQQNMVPVCELGICGLACAEDFYDVDLDLSNGCETPCAVDPFTTPDVPDDLFQDQNCDGIDGTVADGLFVAEDGSNANPGTRAFPLKTITFALNKAEADGKTFLFVSAGTYEETVILKPGIGIHGGYLRASDWSRDGTRGVISGGSTGAVRAQDIDTPTILEYMEIRSATATIPSTSSHAVLVLDSSGFVPRHLTVKPGNGAGGLQGSSAGQTGDDGGDGTTGYNGYEDDSYFYCAGNQTDPPAYQPGGTACIGQSNRGGNGGRGCKTNGSDCAGAAGETGLGTGGGAGGTAYAGGNGGSGIAGSPGAAGTNGSAGAGGVIFSNQWRPNSGGNGSTGSPGGGGGGGAGGGSTHSTGTCNDWGGGGGSGGGGGCGGTGGDGGTGGGASVGILLVNSTVSDAAWVDVDTGDGGNGGAGRDGGSGGPGGLGKAGGSGNDEGKAGGAGRNGGSGGRGGHGGGGAGGWAICVYVGAGSSWNDDGVPSYNPGSVGLGGISDGNGGVPGSAVTVYP